MTLPERWGRLRRRNWVSDDEVPADLDPAPQLDPGIPVPDFELLEAASRVLPALITEAFPRHDQGVTFCHPRFGGAVCVTPSVAR